MDFKMKAVIHRGNNYNNAVVTLTPALQKRPHIGKHHGAGCIMKKQED